MCESVDRLVLDHLRAMTPEARFDAVAELTAASRQLALTRLSATWPEASPRELDLRLASLWLGPELMAAAFQWTGSLSGEAS
jgi:hypothetical protein